ncbi:MAG: four helix bundle protein [Chitinophagaceae bacterium]|nr:MAG: four helix bundle protein [Chitinophagaceae bacterium]
MATIKRIEDIEAWQLARQLSKEIYYMTQTGTFNNDFSLKDQINRSSGSIMDNIAEGFNRNGNKEFIYFLTIAKGSCGECNSQLYRAYDRMHISNELFEQLHAKTNHVGVLLQRFIEYLKRSSFKGQKFK